MKITKLLYSLLLFMIFILVFQGCSHKNNENSSDNSITAPPNSEIKSHTSDTALTPLLKKISVHPDKTFQDSVAKDPYTALSIMTLQVYQNIDRELFNYLYTSVKKQLSKTDISNFKLTNRQIMDTCESLYDRTGFELFYLERIKWSEDYKSVNFTYYDYTEEEINENLEIFYSKMNHLLNNVPISHYSSIQKFFSIYQYITQNASYSYDITDEKTHSPYSILVNKMGICTGFSRLTHYVLNQADIPTLYISNNSHAWNLVTLLDSRFITDFTWGAGFDNQSYLNTALMDDDTRRLGLVNAGFGGEEIIVGYPRENAKNPDACTDKRFESLKSVYDNYGLDILNGWIYYTLENTLFRIQMEGINKEKLLSNVGRFSVYEGIIYYRNEVDGGLYSLKPGENPSPLDTSLEVDFLNITDGILTYQEANTSIAKEINLNKFNTDNYNFANATHEKTFQTNNQASYYILLTFSTPMEVSELPRSHIGLVTELGKLIPLHMYWDDSGYELLLRPASFIDKDQKVTLYIDMGIQASNGVKTTSSFDLVIEPKP